MLRLLRLVLFLFCFWLHSLMSPPLLRGADLLVNSSWDQTDLTPGNGLCVAFIIIIFPGVYAVCSLRAAIEEANALPGADTIHIPSGTYSLSVTGVGEDSSRTGDLDITDSLTIIGAGAENTTISGAGVDRVFDIVNSEIKVSISDVSIVDGVLASAQPLSQKGGGGIRNRSNLTLRNVVIKNNRVHGGGSEDSGGGLQNYGTTHISKSSIENNQAHWGGGAANAGSATLVFDMVTLSNNVAMSGGGISNGGRTYLQNSTVSGNRAEGNDSLGGGIHNFQVLELFQSTVAENSASKGGGIHNEKIAYLFNALVANNEGGDCYLLEKPHSFGSNLDSDSSCRLVGKFGDISGVEPRLGPLADYGGTTKTHRLMPGSPAIDAGKTYLSFSSDQRGLLRPQGQGWDIGAVEFEGFSIAPILFPLLLD